MSSLMGKLTAFSLLVFFFFFFLLSPATSSPRERKGCYIKSIYSFGDSIADTGNLIRQDASGPFSNIAHLPYGETTFKRPTGRCSDGLLMIDYLALALKLPLLDPYLKKHGNFEHGVNFAVAGATALDSSFFEKRGIMLPYTNGSLSVQLQWFKTHLDSVCSSPSDVAKKFEHALFMVGEIGGNDYNYAFISGKPIDEVMSYVPDVVQTIANAAKELIDLGAVHLVIPGNFPIGCLPIYLTALPAQNREAFDENKCLKDMNAFAMFHNTRLQGALQELREKYPHVVIMYADYYQAFMHLLENASALGFEEGSVLKACCGSGGEYNFDSSKMCGSPGVSACKNPGNYMSWDGIHLTQRAYKIMARELIWKRSTYPADYGLQKKWKCKRH